MGTYIGCMENIENGSGIFFNFKPLAELNSSQVHVLSPDEQANLLKKSEKRDINLKYNLYIPDELQKMRSRFPNHSLTVFEFEPEDLEDNKDGNGDYRLTGYKVSANDMLQRGKIQQLRDVGVYYVLTTADFDSGYDFIHSPLIALKTSFLTPNDQVLIQWYDCLVGPYNVFFSETLSAPCIGPKIKERKYTASGYQKDDVPIYQLSAFSAPIAVLPKNIFQKLLDLIPDADLLNDFFEELSETPISDGTIQIKDIPQLMDKYQTSNLSGRILTPEIQNLRSERLVQILSSEEKANDILNRSSEEIINLFSRCKDNPAVREWLDQATTDLKILNRLGDIPVISEKVGARIDEINDTLAEKERENSELDAQKRTLLQSIEQLQQQAEDAKQKAVEQLGVEFDNIKADLENKKNELYDVCERLNIAEDLDTLKNKFEIEKEVQKQRKKDLEEDNSKLESKKSELENEKSKLKSELDNEKAKFKSEIKDYIKNQKHEMVSIAFDGFMSSQMIRAATQWENEQASKNDDSLFAALNSLSPSEKTPLELAEYLCNTIQSVRPNYNRNAILNIAICMTQGFLTVFSGEPGCGKTSICNLFGQVLGLNKIALIMDSASENAAQVIRYIPVSVEKGWTSKRDFIGYYNPLSKAFDQNNSRVYQALRFLDKEARSGIHKFPMLILLDEANLSPMEYYWSDFMNICDDLNSQSTINLGENYIFHIPETLHFLATINNDHTTEVLSPRLIDRAWVITLPQYTSTLPNNCILDDSILEIISWESLHDAFIPGQIEEFSLPVKSAYDEVVSQLKKMRITVSPRVDRAIRRYWTSAKELFEPIDETDAKIVALDYAVAQRLLPKIAGNGEDFRNWLTELRQICTNNGLNWSALILKDILDRGNQQMNYYQFFY